MSETKEKTALITSVGADAEQPSVNIFMNSIDDGTPKINGNRANAGALDTEKANEAEVYGEEEACNEEKGPNEAEAWKKLQRSLDPRYLNTATMTELYDRIYQNRPPR